ncbi:uncharacterized protein LOC134229995 [Saccostrea cucullata]|uniref:uncharacterized protein LOC134229995 n=1 Tax=Saccostrea cuccullata TaxID=36930 RepID=UPI002ED4D429
MIAPLGEVSLKPRKKLVLLNQYALPRLMYPLQQDDYPKSVLKKLDRMVRATVRCRLKLPNSIFYESMGDGGFGLPELTKSISAQRVNMLRGICRYSDSKINRMTDVLQTQVFVKRLTKDAGLSVPEKPAGRVRWHRLVRKATEDLNIGKAAKSFRFSESNSWLITHAKYFCSEADYITDVSLRAETYSCIVTMARARASGDVNRSHLGSMS